MVKMSTSPQGVGRADVRVLQVEKPGKHFLVHLTTLKVARSYQSAGKWVKARSALRTARFHPEESL
jgi:hypothetical protein